MSAEGAFGAGTISGRRWFLSYHSPDHDLASRVQSALSRLDAGAEVFFAPASLRAGSFWTKGLADAITEADAFVLLIGDHGVGRWQVVEYLEALDRRVKDPAFPLIVVLLEGKEAPGLPFLRRLHLIAAKDPGSDAIIGRLVAAAQGADSGPSDFWRYTFPYRGLAAMEEQDSDYFFGRGEETLNALGELEASRGRIPILIGNSGVGKTSLVRAGIIAALKRQAWPDVPGDARTSRPWPNSFEQSRRWCYLTFKPGNDPIRSLVGAFLTTWLYEATDAALYKKLNEWTTNLRDGSAHLVDLLDATVGRYRALRREAPPAFLIYVDQGEELYTRRADAPESANAKIDVQLSTLLARAAADSRLRILMSMRADFLGELQKDEQLYKVHKQVDTPPLREEQLRQVVSRPAELLGVRFEEDSLIKLISESAALDTIRDVGALPLLSYTLDDMWKRMVKRGDGVLRIAAQSFDLSGVLVQRAEDFLAANPGATGILRRILTQKLANVRQGEEPTRRRAARAEFDAEEWRLVCELADHPNRLLVTVTPQLVNSFGGSEAQSYAEVAHETLFRRWKTLADWIRERRDFLIWQTEIREDRIKRRRLSGVSLITAHARALEHRLDIGKPDRDYIARAWRQQRMRQGALLTAAFLGILGAGWSLWDRYAMSERLPLWLSTTVHSGPAKAGVGFQECAKCPQMVVLPLPETFSMGQGIEEDLAPLRSPIQSNERPRHTIVFPRPFAVARFELSYDEWDVCHKLGGCRANPRDDNGRGSKPVTYVNWNDAQEYVAWLSRWTGKTYRLLTEAEWEYAARGGTQTNFWWGNGATRNRAPMANCIDCGSASNGRATNVDSFSANPFGLHNMNGNVWEWVEDCYHESYEGKPESLGDGSAWKEGQNGNCESRVVRGGAVTEHAGNIRSGFRGFRDTSEPRNDSGIRVARNLD